jgi:hypothetical protein
MPLSSVVGAQSIVKPGVCTSSTRPASPFEGQMIYETDTDAVKVWDGSAWVGAVNAASLNGVGTPISFTPSWANLTVGNGTQTFNYTRVNNFVFVNGKISFGSTTSVSGNVSFATPVTTTNQADVSIVGQTYLTDSGVGNYIGFVAYSGNNFYLQILLVNGTYPTAQAFNATTPFTWSVNDSITVNAVYVI